VPGRPPHAIDLHVPDLATLHERRSEKWTGHDDDVLAATTAEMDFPLAEPVAAVLRAAIDRNDLGYATPAPRRLRDAFSGFALRRLRWDVDPEQITLVPDVMVGLVELSRLLAGSDEAVGFVTPAYPRGRLAAATSPGWTAVDSASETTRPRRSSNAGAWRSAPA
jgi:cysteine-S-conjugate beta-lyase